MNNTSYPQGLRLLLAIGTLGALLTGLPAVFYPSLVVALSGLDPAAIPAMQQSGALALGFAVAGLMALRSHSWREVRISVAASFVTFVLTFIGAFYYVVILGVATPGLVLILVVAVIITLGYGFYLWQYAQKGELLS